MVGFLSEERVVLPVHCCALADLRVAAARPRAPWTWSHFWAHARSEWPPFHQSQRVLTPNKSDREGLKMQCSRNQFVRRVYHVNVNTTLDVTKIAPLRILSCEMLRHVAACSFSLKVSPPCSGVGSISISVKLSVMYVCKKSGRTERLQI